MSGASLLSFTPGPPNPHGGPDRKKAIVAVFKAPVNGVRFSASNVETYDLCKVLISDLV